ncbi:MAG: hypothetical protein Q9191_007898 [Dirinaria sp. TL-2023a]
MALMSHSNDYPWSPKAAKLRAACNQCHASKVRCSGEKSGCLRCQNLDYECVYSISRAGRTPGTRNKNKRVRTANEPSGSDSPASRSDSLDEPAMPMTRDSSVSFLHSDSFIDWVDMGDPGDIFQPSTLDGDKDTFKTSHDLMTTNVSQPAGVQDPLHDLLTASPSAFNLDVLQLDQLSDTGRNQVNGSSSGSSSSPSSVSRPSTQKKPQRPQLQSRHSAGPTVANPKAPIPVPFMTNQTSSPSPVNRQCIQACSKVMEYLDRVAQKDTLPLDEVMHVNKTFISAISRIMALDKSEKSVCCPPLIAIAMDQMISLFESVFFKNRPTAEYPSKTDVAAAAPQLRLGSFQIDAEEHAEMRAYIVCRELRKCKQTLESLAAMLQRPEMRRVQSLTLHKQWVGEMARRLESLVTTVEETWR